MDDFRTIVLNKGQKPTTLSGLQKHIERTALSYQNQDIFTSESHRNVFFKKAEGTYRQSLQAMLDNKSAYINSVRSNVNVFDGFVFSINPQYFEQHGGYEGAVKFFGEAYEFAKKEAGGEQYVVSAVMHADERAYLASVEKGADVWNYHLHVVYAPVVEMDRQEAKHIKGEGLPDKLMVINHSKRWPFTRSVKENVATVENAYSQLQDRFFEHMKNAGFEGIVRGESRANGQKLSQMRYKVEKTSDLLSTLESRLEEVKSELAKVEAGKEKLSGPDETTRRLVSQGNYIDELIRKVRAERGLDANKNAQARIPLAEKPHPKKEDLERG